MSTPSDGILAQGTIRVARGLRAVSWLLEAGVGVVVVASVAAFGSVHPWAYVTLWCACLGLGGLLLCRALAVGVLRRAWGRTVFAFHHSSRWLVLDTVPAYGAVWSFDLARPLLPRLPLLAPGLGFGAWVLLQLLPLPSVVGAWLGRAFSGSPDVASWRPLTISAGPTLRGLAFLTSALLVHVAAGTVFDRRESAERFRRVVAGLGVVLTLIALAQSAAGTARIYGLFESLEGGNIFGPFVNRNHFAGYMLMVAAIALSLLGRSYRRYAIRAGPWPVLRRRAVALSSGEGIALIYASIPALASVAALIATTSRGGIAAFAASLVLAGVGRRRGRGVPAWALALACGGMAVSWFGLERLEGRFLQAAGDVPGRTVVWRDTLGRMQGLWLVGSGFNTFGLAMSRVAAWTLPVGATPWPPPVAEPLLRGLRVGYRAPEGTPGQEWYREAHNDYLQVLVETGVPGLLIALWGAGSVLLAVRRDPWLLAALTGVLLHVLVDFDLQIPAISVLFVGLAAMPPESREHHSSPTALVKANCVV